MQAEEYLHDKLKRKGMRHRQKSRKDELIDTYATLYGKKEFVGLDTHIISKRNAE